MARSIVTSDNKVEYDEAHMARRKREYEKDLTAAEKASSEAKEDAASHEKAMRAHKQASIYAHPPENIEKHLERAKHHAAEMRKYERLEKERNVKKWEEGRRMANIRFNKRKGITASSDEEKRTGKYTAY